MYSGPVDSKHCNVKQVEKTKARTIINQSYFICAAPVILAGPVQSASQMTDEPPQKYYKLDRRKWMKNINNITANFSCKYMHDAN